VLLLKPPSASGVRPSALREGLALRAPVVVAGSAPAWSNHALCTWPALSRCRASRRPQPVAAEPLEDFLAAEGKALATLLDDEERWARAHVPTYPARPDGLAFRPDGATPAEARRRFLAALRINPDVRSTLYLQVPPGQDRPQPSACWARTTSRR
jgi:hypothetical protein